MVVKVGITGANGRIGTTLWKQMKDMPDVFALRLFVYKPPEYAGTAGANPEELPIPDGIEQRFVDFSKESSVLGAFDVLFAETAKKKLVKKYRAKLQGLDVVIHLAALVDVTPLGKSWEAHRASNFDTTMHVVQEAVRAKVKRVIYASSNHTQAGPLIPASERGQPYSTDLMDRALLTKPLDIGEDFPSDLYGVAKLFGENIGKIYALHTPLEFVSIRIGWVLSGIADDVSALKGTKFEVLMRSLYLSHRDCLGFFRAAIDYTFPTDPKTIKYAALYACSDNAAKIFNMQPTIDTFKYTPVDSVEKFFD